LKVSSFIIQNDTAQGLRLSLPVIDTSIPPCYQKVFYTAREACLLLAQNGPHDPSEGATLCQK
ncbi:hypothetical protein Q6296_28710, partial [Klebsiella variicola]|uniref:hypothetical protein n=1 Tax=Klebsiella variicola TaxID=244366 RepID=UPI002730409D